MISLNINQKSIEISFFHTNNNNEKSTKCNVRVNNHDYFEIAKVHYKDTFCRAAGRRYSLAKTLRTTNLNKEERKFVWFEYFKQTNKPLLAESVMAKFELQWD